MQLALVEDEPVHKQLALRFRDRDGLWLFVPNDKDSVHRLLRLSRSHVFEVAHDQATLFVSQGRRPMCVPKDFLRPRYQEKHRVIHPLASDCAHCPRRHGCRGPRFMSPEVSDLRGREATGIELLRESIFDHEARECPMFVDGRVNEVTIRDQELRDLGWDLRSSSRAFTEDPDDDPEVVYRLQGVDLSSPLAIGEALDDTGWYPEVIADGFRRSGWRRGAAGDGAQFSDLFFDETRVGINLLRQRVRAIHAGRWRGKRNAYAKEHCAKCVFSCEKTPWSLDHPQPLTREQIMDENVPDDDDRAWMAMFKVCGHKGRFVNPSTGRRRLGIGNRPTRLKSGDWGIDVCSLGVGAGHIDDVGMKEYWDSIYGPIPDYERPVLARLDDEALRFTFWALGVIDRLTSYNRATFDIGGLRGHMGNDVFYIDLDDRLRDYDPSGPRITVGSDTRASHSGGFGYNGRHIAMDDRPRFTTEYNHPHYADGIWSWFTEAPGACNGRKK